MVRFRRIEQADAYRSLFSGVQEVKVSKAMELRRIYEANIACGDIGEAEEARMLADSAAAEAEEHAAPRAVAA